MVSETAALGILFSLLVSVGVLILLAVIIKIWKKESLCFALTGAAVFVAVLIVERWFHQCVFDLLPHIPV